MEMEDQAEENPEKGIGGPSGAYETDDGALVLYEEGNPDAYIRSDVTADVEQ